jgi:molecular chaperone DnaJ
LNVDDAYRELGLARSATDPQVKAAWRRAAAEWHPDRNASPQAPRRIQRINRAYQEICRARVPAGAEEVDDSGFGPDDATHHDITLTLEEACVGCSRLVEGAVVEGCSACEGSGVAPLSACTACAGEGRVRQQVWFPWLSPWGSCRDCRGSGVARAPCAPCGGSGRAPERAYRCRVRIPAGVRDGDIVTATARLQGRADPRELALHLRIALAPNDVFVLHDDGTLKCELPVNGFAWMANRWIEVPTPDGPQQMRLRRDALVYRIRGRGFPVERGGARGDCLVTVTPRFPEELSLKQEALVDALIAS